jgi:hypothetical protein
VKSSGLGNQLYLGGYDLSGTTGSLSKIASPHAVLDVTAIDKSAMERIGALRDGVIDFMSYWDSVNAHPSLSALPRTDIGAMFAMSKVLGTQAACMVAKQLNYDPTRATGGALTAAVALDANGYGMEWCRTLTAGKRVDTAATNGASVDDGATNAPSVFGAQFYLQVFAFTGTDVTVKIQDSADNTSFADLATAAFAQVTSTTPQTQRIAISNAATVRRYLRATTVTTGGFTSATFAVAYNRNPLASQVF